MCRKENPSSKTLPTIRIPRMVVAPRIACKLPVRPCTWTTMPLGKRMQRSSSSWDKMREPPCCRLWCPSSGVLKCTVYMNTLFRMYSYRSILTSERNMLYASKHLAVLPSPLLFLFQTSPCINWSNASLDIPDILITTFTATKGKGIRASQPNVYSTDNYTTSRLWNKYVQRSSHRYEKKSTMHYLYTDWLIMIKASPAAPRTRYEPSVHPPQPAQTSRPIATSTTQRKLEHNKGGQNPKKSGLCGIWQFGEIGGAGKNSWMQYSPWTADRIRVQHGSTIIFL